jgi:hypothetical protein
MPPRLLSLAVVVLWLATTGWLITREVLPHFRPGEPPPVAIDLVDEAQRHAAPVLWIISRDGKRIGSARSWVTYRESDDTFTLHNEIIRMEFNLGFLATFTLRSLHTSYRVTRNGELRGMHADIRADSSLLPSIPKEGLRASDAQIKGQVVGEVQKQRFTAHGWVEALNLGHHDFTLEPVEVSEQGTVLNPLHPVNRLLNVRPGQRWRMPVVNLLAEALARSTDGVLPSGLLPSGPRFLDAEVLAEPQMLAWGQHEVRCLIIECRHEQEVKARIWVREGDGLVLRQEALQDREMLVLERGIETDDRTR